MVRIENPIAIIRSDLDDEPIEFTANGEYSTPDGKRYNPISVNVSEYETEEHTYDENGTFYVPSGKRYNPINVDVTIPETEAHEYTENGVYHIDEDKRYDPITVSVPQARDSSMSFTANGIYTPEEGIRWTPVVVNVPQGGSTDVAKTITENGTYVPSQGERFNPVYVNVPLPTAEAHTYTSNGTFAVPEGKLYSPITVAIPVVEPEFTINGEYHISGDEIHRLIKVNVPQPTMEAHTFTENGTFVVPMGKQYNPITVNVQGGGADIPVGEKLKSMLLLWLDGIKNAGEDAEHSSSAATWKDLSGQNNDFTVSNGAWGSDNLIFNGTSTFAFCDALNPNVFTLEIALNIGTSADAQFVSTTGTDFDATRDDFASSIFAGQNGLGYSVSSSIDAGEYSNVSGFFNEHTAQTAEVLTLVCDGTHIRAYVNGVKQTVIERAMDFISHRENNVFLIGATMLNGETLGGFLSGNVYSVRLWSSGFSDSNVAELAAETMERFNIGGQTT